MTDMTVLGAMLNFLLIYLIKKKTVKEMKMYTRILLSTCLNNLYNLILSAIVQPIYIVDDGHSIIFQNGVLRTQSSLTGHITYMAWFLGFYFSVLFLPVQFIYRYLVLCRGCHISNYSFILMIATISLLASFECYLLSSAGFPSPPYDKLPHNSSCFPLLKESHSLDVMLSPQWKYQQSEKYRIFALMLILNAISYTVIGWCSLRIWAFMSKYSSNARIKEINQQLTVTLLAQALLPAFVLFVTSFALVILLFVVDDSTTFFAMTYVTIPLNWMAVLCPLLTIFIVKPYRNFMLCKKAKMWNASEISKFYNNSQAGVAKTTSLINLR